jgi:hypothetical protein
VIGIVRGFCRGGVPHTEDAVMPARTCTVNMEPNLTSLCVYALQGRPRPRLPRWWSLNRWLDNWRLWQGRQQQVRQGSSHQSCGVCLALVLVIQ